MTGRNQLYYILLTVVICLLSSCAKMGQPDGGWYDETPPRILGASPSDKATEVTDHKMYIYFNEFIKLSDATQKVVVSPPQMEAPDIKDAGKRIIIDLKDSLKANTTYTIDFSDAISDNNEGNPLGNYTYSFSTGTEIDTMEVSGYVYEAENLEPIKGILVGLYDNLADSVFRKEPFQRVSRTDSRGRFVIKGIKPGNFRVYALMDADGNYLYNQKSEKIAFSRDIIVPSCKPDIRQDTIWRDSLHIDNILRVPYTHFFPDDIVLRAFTEEQTDRFLLKSERKEPNRFTLTFSHGDADLPIIRGLDFEAENAFVVESSEKNDSITYWLRDTLLVNQDTLQMEVQYHATDSAGLLYMKTDTLSLLSKESYAKRLKQKEKEYADWKKKQEKAEKRGDPFQKEMPVPPLNIGMNFAGDIDPDKNPVLTFETPLEVADTSKIHLYSKHDTLWYRSPFLLREKVNVPRTYEVIGEWRPDIEYSLEIDSAAFVDIYGSVSNTAKKGFKVKSNDAYGTIFMTLDGMRGKRVVAQLLSSTDVVMKEVRTQTGNAEFFYVNPNTYYLRIFVDENDNGKWDTGNYDEGRQAEAVYYYPSKIECKERWDITESWNPLQGSATALKPGELVKQKGEKAKTMKSRNLERAKKLGIELLKENMPY
ncbi:MAG: Ig-like domain-containing protein [Prevotella sp.]|nr:Ig-like domain-containing protein [Prevotella sp.]